MCVKPLSQRPSISLRMVANLCLVDGRSNRLSRYDRIAEGELVLLPLPFVRDVCRVVDVCRVRDVCRVMVGG